MISLRPDAQTLDTIDRFSTLFAGVAQQEHADAWRALATAGALALAPDMITGTLAAEQAGRHLVGLRYLDALFAADIAAALGGDGLADAIGAGRLACAVAVDRRLNARCGTDTGEVEASLGLRGPVLQGQARFVRGVKDADLLMIITPAEGAITVATVPVERLQGCFQREDDLDADLSPNSGDLYQVEIDRLRLQPEELQLWPVSAPSWSAIVDRARIRLAAYLIGVAAGAIEAAVQHTRNRVQFGRPVATFQAVSFPLAAALARIRAARLLCWHAAWAADQGLDAAQLAAQALSHTADMAIAATTQALQAHGAVGLTRAHAAQRFYRRAVVASVWLGTSRALAEYAAPRIASGGTHRIGWELDLATN